MKAALKIIQRSLVIEFYKQNAAFFGLILLIFFGFIKSSEHIVIGSFLVSNPGALIFLYILWFAYTIKVILFLLPAINKPENQFLESFILLDNQTKLTIVVSASTVLLMPVLFYAAFLMLLSLNQGFFLPIISIFVYLIILISALAIIINYRLIGLQHEKKIFQFRVFKKITIPPQLFFISFLIRKEIVLVILTKIYGILLIIGTTALYKTDDFDLRLMTTGVLLASIGNVAILHKYVWFQYHPMAFSLNLPVKFFRITFGQISTFFILLIPEMMALIRHFPLESNFLDFSGLLFLAIGLCYIMYGWMIRRQVELSNFIIVVFWLVVLSTFFILFSVHPIILGLTFVAISMIFTYLRYYQYEHLD